MDAKTVEACAQLVERRGREVGGAIDPTITAKLIRDMLKDQSGQTRQKL